MRTYPRVLLVLLVCTLIATIASIRLHISVGAGRLRFGMYPGYVRIGWSDAPALHQGVNVWLSGPRLLWSFEWFDGLLATADGSYVRARSVVIPLWSIVAVLGVLVLARSKRRVLVGHCNCCRYDLTGNVSGTCPECGTLIERET